MGFIEAVNTVLFKKYATFKGRASRSEYWWFVLFNISVYFIGIILTSFLFAYADHSDNILLGIPSVIASIAFIVYCLAAIIPNIAVTVRRFHDRNLSGWWVLLFYGLSIIPVINLISCIAMLVITCRIGTNGNNRFGTDPLGDIEGIGSAANGEPAFQTEAAS